MAKKSRLRQQGERVLVTIAVMLAYIILVPIMIIPAFIYHYFFVRPILYVIETEPLYWLNWKDVKQKSGKSTGMVLSTLFNISFGHMAFDCQLRPEQDLLRLERLLHQKRPYRDRPFTQDEVIFFQYRRTAGGPGKRHSFLFRNMFPILRPAVLAH